VEHFGGKGLGRETTFEVGYLGSRAFISSARISSTTPLRPGAIGPRRPYKFLAFVDNSVLPSGLAVSPTMPAGCPPGAICTPVSTINLSPTRAGWYDAGYLNVRRRLRAWLGLLANYTFARA